MLSSRKIVGIIVAAVILAAAFGYYFSSEGRGEEKQVWWIASDPHLGVHGENFYYMQKAIEDVNEYVQKVEGVKVDYAIQLGDEIHETMKYREDFFQLMNSLEVKDWYYILGNHDFVNLPSEENILPVVDTTIDVMGMKWILISDHAGDSSPRTNPQVEGGTMPENVREWFVIQILLSEKPIFVFSHQPPGQWKVWNEELRELAVGTKLRAWFYGHIHRWSARWMEDEILIISDCSIDWAGHCAGMFMFLERKGDTVDVTLKFRNHENHAWIQTPIEGELVDNISFSVEVT